mgnify:CR=1 FL=1
MTSLTNLANIASRWAGASQAVVNAVKNASSRTGVSFDYLMNKARQESSFNPSAKAKTSSATGLFQFIDSTWLQAVKSYGDQFGLGDLAAKVSTDGRVADTVTRQQILKLREDPNVAAGITAAMTKDNADYLANSLGGKVGETDLYLAHFLGLNGANKFLKAKIDNPFQAAADLFPSAAHANKTVFYDASGRKRSMDEVYAFFAQRMNDTPQAAPVVDSVVAVKTPSVTSPVLPEVPVIIGAAGRGFAITPDIAASQGMGSIGLSVQRKMLETLLAGMQSFGADTGSRTVASGSLLSPYTAMILASLQAPSDTVKTEQGIF